MSIYGHWNRGLVLIISAFLLSFSFASFADESVESVASNMEASSDSDKNLECVIEDEVLGGCWMVVESNEDCESDITGYQTDESDQILCFISEEFVTETQVSTDEEALECVIEDEVLGNCWTAVESEEDCESGTTFYQTDESDQILCLVVEESKEEGGLGFLGEILEKIDESPTSFTRDEASINVYVPTEISE